MKYRSQRYPTQYPVVLETAVGPQRSTVVDVSITGARIQGFHHLSRGEKLFFNILTHRIDAVVLWVSGNKAGLVFRPALSDQHFETLSYRPNIRTSLRPGTVGFAFTEMR